MSKTIKYSILIPLLALVGLIAGLYFQSVQKVGANPSNRDTVYMTKGGGSYTATAPATTTEGVTYLAQSASTTFPVYVERADRVNLNFQMTGSTTASILGFTYETSNDNSNCANDPNICTWAIPEFATSTQAGSFNVYQLASSTPYYTWKPNGEPNGTTTLSVTIDPASSRFIRVKAQVLGSAGALWISATANNQQP